MKVQSYFKMLSQENLADKCALYSDKSNWIFKSNNLYGMQWSKNLSQTKMADAAKLVAEWAVKFSAEIKKDPEVNVANIVANLKKYKTKMGNEAELDKAINALAPSFIQRNLPSSQTVVNLLGIGAFVALAISG